ncbi:MAG: class I SAM-dependent methyltransferase [Methanomassiliicoccales archaeon]|nr:MAG: class I SAM-dependent methyltransferase [Methanomassiliicoccales archaeon]
MMTSGKGASSSGRSVTSIEDAADQYELFAKYYDIWHEDFTEDIEFYKRMASSTGGPVLVCMCGTGRTLIPLAKEGYEITGFDLSDAMLDKLTAKLETLDEEVLENVHVGHADIRDFMCGKRYRLIFVPFNSFLHLLETADQEVALRNIAEHLDDEGRFVLSMFNPQLDRPENLLRHRGTRMMRTGEIITWFESQTFDRSKQTTTSMYFFDISRQDKDLRRVTTSVTLRYMFMREAVELLERCGLEVVETYGDYLQGPFRDDSKMMVFVARKSQ